MNSIIIMDLYIKPYLNENSRVKLFRKYIQNCFITILNKSNYLQDSYFYNNS